MAVLFTNSHINEPATPRRSHHHAIPNTDSNANQNAHNRAHSANIHHSPQADPFAVYAQISGTVAAVNLSSVEGNSVTVVIIVLVDESDPLFVNPFETVPSTGSGQAVTTQPDKSPAQIVHVKDGDTVDVLFLDGRFQGTEETITVKPDAPVECYGSEASEYTKRILVEGTAVLIELDGQTGERDRYGRLLAHVW
ncbi:MAG: hypothetical protein GY805_30015 [Chloroflexi bacterium]|nr:hypothetical protein [Chloroflexota bacterium]